MLAISSIWDRNERENTKKKEKEYAHYIRADDCALCSYWFVYLHKYIVEIVKEFCLYA